MPGSRTLSLALLAACLVQAVPAAADMFVWTDPHTGQKHMSNIPPPWLGEEGRRGPRVEVVRGTKVMDAAKALSAPPEAASQAPQPAPPAASTTPAAGAAQPAADAAASAGPASGTPPTSTLPPAKQ